MKILNILLLTILTLMFLPSTLAFSFYPAYGYGVSYHTTYPEHWVYGPSPYTSGYHADAPRINYNDYGPYYPPHSYFNPDDFDDWDEWQKYWDDHYRNEMEDQWDDYQEWLDDMDDRYDDWEDAYYRSNRFYPYPNHYYPRSRSSFQDYPSHYQDYLRNSAWGFERSYVCDVRGCRLMNVFN